MWVSRTSIRGRFCIMVRNHADLIKLGHELEGQTLSEEALDRAERVLYGVTTPEEARKELEQKWKRNT